MADWKDIDEHGGPAEFLHGHPLAELRCGITADGEHLIVDKAHVERARALLVTIASLKRVGRTVLSKMLGENGELPGRITQAEFEGYERAFRA